MLTQGMARRQQRMLEILLDLMLHAEALHQPLRGQIGRHSKGDRKSVV